MEEISAKRVSNYELFYDLVFALAMARLVEFFHTGNLSIGAFLGFANSTIVVLSIWMHQTLYLNKYGRRDRLDVYLNIPAMFIIGNFALTFGTSTFGVAEYVQYNVMMILAHTCILLQYYLRGRKEGFNADIKWSMISLGIVITYFVLLFILGAVFRFYEFAERVTSFIWCLWLIPIFIPLVFVRKIDLSIVNFPHLVERTQLLTIISFGEMVLGIIRNYPVSDDLFISIAFFVGAAFMFTAYISQTHLTVQHEQKTAGIGWAYAHFPIILGINCTTVGIEMMGGSGHGKFGIFLLVIGLILFYVSLGSTSIYNHEIYRFGWTTYLPYALVLVLSLVLMTVFQDQVEIVALVFGLMAFVIPHLHYRDRLQRQKALDQD